jgi:hypothetical protein
MEAVEHSLTTITSVPTIGDQGSWPDIAESVRQVGKPIFKTIWTALTDLARTGLNSRESFPFVGNVQPPIGPFFIFLSSQSSQSCLKPCAAVPSELTA